MKIDIELTEKQEHFLKLFAKNQHPGAKDNVCTNKPIHAVQIERFTIVDNDYDYDKIVYLVSDWEYAEFETDTLHELVEQYYEESDEQCPIKIVNYDKAYDDYDFRNINEDEFCVCDEESLFEDLEARVVALEGNIKSLTDVTNTLIRACKRAKIIR